MALITRVARLFRADFHAVLDRIEEPGMLLRQAVREMEEELARDEQRVRVLHHEQEQLIARREDIAQSLVAIEDELDVCFASNKDQLARSTVKRRLEAERFSSYLTRRCETLQRELAGFSQRIEQNRLRLDGMRQKVELLAEEETGRGSDGIPATPDLSVREEEVEVAFLREKQKRRGS